MTSAPPDPLLPRLPLMWLTAGSAVIGAALRVLIVPVLVGSLFDDVLLAGEYGRLGQVLLVGFLVTVGGAVALFLQDAGFGRLAARVTALWRSAIYRSQLGRSALDRQQTSGGLASRITSDLREVEIYLQYGLGSLIAETATIVAITAFLLAANPLATLLLLVLAAPVAVALWLMGRKIERASREVLERTEETGSHLQEGLGQLEVARTFGLQRFLGGRLAAESRALEAAQSRRAAWAGLQVPASQVLGYGALAGLIAVLASSVQSGAMSLGQLTSFITLVALLGTPLQLLPRAWAMRKQAAAASVRLSALLAGSRAATGSEAPGGAGLRFENAGFSYDGGNAVLEGVDLTLETPGLVAITGESGAGKTTLLRLALGLLQPTSGRVLAGGLPLDRIQPAELQKLMAYVPQDAALYRASIRENVDLGRGYPDKDIMAVLELVGLGSLIRELPGQLDHVLPERGGGVSGGQRQRLALARALLGGPAILLLDEPTSNLDHASEQAITRVLQHEAGRRLVLTTTHRPALLEAATSVLEVGRTVRHSKVNDSQQ